MSKTALTLIREVASRFGPSGQGFFLTGTSLSGTVTTLVDQTLLQYMPNDNTMVNGWIHCPVASTDVGNQGLERRIKQWTASSYTATLYAPGFPAIPANGPYEINTRMPRSRVLEAINSAVRDLGLFWYREFVDETITTVDKQWRYVLPASQNWARVASVDIQINTDTTLTGYPYASADEWGWREYLTVSATGTQIRYIQFTILPPPTRTLRVTGEGMFPDLAADTDILAMEPKWEGPCVEWIYDMAIYRLNQWAPSPATPTAESEKYRVKELQMLQEARESLRELLPVHKGSRIVTPYNGYGRYDASASDDPRWFGAFSNPK